jgi:uncharacterized membrane protein
VGQDIYYSWVEGARILAGENPYSRVLQSDMRKNDKYATYFPLFYELSAVSQWAGLDGYYPWIAFWRAVFLACEVGIVLVLFLFFASRGQLTLAVFSALFWLFNRWSLHVVEIGDLEPMPLVLLVVSLVSLEQRPRLSMLLYGASLALKQVAIFLVPIYLVWAWNRSSGDRWREVARAALTILAIPLATSLPFLAWDASGFLHSVAFSVTRTSESALGVPSLDWRLGWSGLGARLPMLAVMATVFAAYRSRSIGLYMACLLVMTVFLEFNTVLFRQYFVWTIPLLLLAPADFIARASSTEAATTADANTPSAG